MQNTKKILVTGGAGFLGSHLCEALLKKGHFVICIDNFLTGSKDHIKELLSSKRFTLIEHDICFPLELEVDEIYNFACPASPIHYQADPIQTMKTSILGALNLLEMAKGQKTKVLQASTSEVYGDPQVHPQPEEYWGHVNPNGIRSCYDEGKRCAETLFLDYQRKHQVPIKIGRIFNTYGPRMLPNDGRVVSNFTVQALQNEPITIYGDGMQTRSFCYVDDLIEACIRLMNSSISGPINLGNPVEFQILDLAKQIIEITGSRSKITFKPLPLDDPKQRQPDIRKAKEFLRWEPKISLREGLEKTIAYFEKKLKSSTSSIDLVPLKSSASSYL